MQYLLKLLRAIAAALSGLEGMIKYVKEQNDQIINQQRTISRQLHRMEQNMATQADVDAIKASIDQFGTDLSTALDGIQGDLDALKAANPGVDVSALEASVTALGAVVSRATDVDAENPVVPTDPTA